MTGRGEGGPQPPTEMPRKLAALIKGFDALFAAASSEADLIYAGQGLLTELVREDDWLPPAFAKADHGGYRQYLLYRDLSARFSISSFVWGPRQATPIHDHGVWGLVGMLRGAEATQRFRLLDSGLVAETELLLRPGMVDVLEPHVGDIHRVRNALEEDVSISIHIYGADMATLERSSYLFDGTKKSFVSGYSNDAESLPLRTL